VTVHKPRKNAHFWHPSTALKPEHTDVTVLAPYAHLESDCRGVASILARVGDNGAYSSSGCSVTARGALMRSSAWSAAISQRMLTLTLRGLERDGLVTRTVFPTIRRASITTHRPRTRAVEAGGSAGQVGQRSSSGNRSRSEAKFDRRNDVD